jgi:uncharacterized protein (TIGR03118 family)
LEFATDRDQGDQGDIGIPDGFAPFNVQGIGPNLYVTYAKQDPARHDPVAGAGLGFVNVFDSNGNLIQRLENTNSMNAPWGVVWATHDFGEFSNTILVGQFRGGNISAFNPVTRPLPRQHAEPERQHTADRRAVGAAVRQRRQSWSRDHIVLHRGP